MVCTWNVWPETASRTAWTSCVLSFPVGQPRARIASEREIISLAQNMSTRGCDAVVTSPLSTWLSAAKSLRSTAIRSV